VRADNRRTADPVFVHNTMYSSHSNLMERRNCCNLSGGVKCVIHHGRDVREEQHHTYMWREQAIIG